MPAFTLPKTKPSEAKPKPARKGSLKQWAGRMRRKLSADLTKGLAKQSDARSSVSEQILEENDESRELADEPEAPDDLNIADHEHDEDQIADEPTSSTTTPAADPEPATHNDPHPTEQEATDAPAATVPIPAGEQIPPELIPTPTAPTATSTSTRDRSPPPPYHRTSVRLVPSAPPRPYTPLPLTAAPAPWSSAPSSIHWLSAQPDDAPGARLLKLSLV